MTTTTLTDVLTILARTQARVDAGTAGPADLEIAIDAGLIAAEQIAGWRSAEAQAKRIVAAVLDAGSTDRIATASGAAAMRSKPVLVRNFDSAALDALIASYPDVARILTPHRREHLRAGSLRIVKGAGATAANGLPANGAKVNGARKVGAR